MNKLAAVRHFNRVLGAVSPSLSARIAERAFWRPRRLPMRDWEQAVAAQAERITFRFGLSALRWGRPGPTVLMLHGWEGRPTQFANLIAPLLAAGRQVIALDAPAHGRSPGTEADPVVFAEALLEAAAELPPLEAVVGHSMGAAAVAIALSRGLRAGRVVLIAGPASLSSVLERGVQTLGLNAAAADRLRRLTEVRTGVAVEALDIASIGSRLLTPALIVHDRDDDLVSVANAQVIASNWKNAELLQTRGLGHWRVLRDAQFVRAASEFVVGSSLARPAVKDTTLARTASQPAEKHLARQQKQQPPCTARKTLEALSHYG